MSADLQKENEELRKENEELKKEIESLKTTLDKYKESSRFQLKQLKEYNDSLKEQLYNVGDGFMRDKEEEGEEISESTERFQSFVYAPTIEQKHYKEKCCISKIHTSNVLSVIPWTKNDHFLFSTNVMKNLICLEWYDDMEPSVISSYPLSSPCCALTLIQNGTVLLAGCMDGKVYSFSIESENYRITKMTFCSEIKLHEKAILRMKTNEIKNYLLCTSYDNTVSLSTVSSTGTIQEKARYYFQYTCDGIAFSPKHNSILIAERNKPTLNYICLTTGETKEISLNNHDWDNHVSFCVTDIALMHDDEYVIVLTDKGNVVVYDYENNKHVMNYYGGSMLSDSYYNSVLFVDNDEMNIMVTSSDNAIHVFNLYTGKEIDCLKGHQKTIRNMYYERGVRPLVFSCAYDHTIRIWGY